jgi:hypothetical protein
VAAHDLLTLAEGRSAINLPDPEQPNPLDDELQLFITGLSGRVDTLCGPVVQRAVTGEEHDGGRERILLRKQHVTAVTSAVEWQNGVSTALTVQTNASPAGTCRLYRGDQTIYAWLLRMSGTSKIKFADGLGNVVVGYTAGRYTATATVDTTFKLAATAVLRRLWKREQSSWAQAPDFFPDTDNPAPSLAFFKAVDPMICELLAGEMLPPVGI